MKEPLTVGGPASRIHAPRSHPLPPPAEFHVPISPTEHFFTMVHYLAASLRAGGTLLSSCPIIVTVGEDREPYDLRKPNPWSENYPITWTWIDRELFRTKSYYATALERFRHPFRARAVVMLDADVLVTGDLSSLIGRVLGSNVLHGLVAHGSPFLFTAPAINRPNREWWTDLFRRAELGEPEFACEHTGWKIMFDDPNYRYCPPYFNFGVLVAPAEVMTSIGATIYREVAHVEEVLDTVFRCQLGLALALRRQQISWSALDVRYNFPNYSSFWTAHPQEARDPRILHYLGRDEGFRKEVDIADVASVRRFLDRKGLPDVNVRLQEALRALQPIVERDNASPLA